MDAALVGIVCGLMGWGLIVLVTYLRRKRHKTEKKPVPSRGPVEVRRFTAKCGCLVYGSMASMWSQLGGDASYAPMNPPLSPGPFNRGLPERKNIVSRVSVYSPFSTHSLQRNGQISSLPLGPVHNPPRCPPCCQDG